MSEQFYRAMDSANRKRFEQKTKDQKKAYKEKQKEFHDDGHRVVSQNIEDRVETHVDNSKPIRKIYSRNSKVRKVNI